MLHFRCPWIVGLLSFAWLCGSAATVSAQIGKEDGWERQRDERSGLLVQTKAMTVHPRSAPRPALRHRLLPDPFDLRLGNAAVYYLKASGFLEQEAARNRLHQFRKEAREKAQKEGLDLGRVPPYGWLNTPPNELPIPEVKQYLRLTAFQPPMLREGALRDRFDMDRRFREVDDPIGYLLPEIQNLRELARNHSIRCRLAIAEGRVDDAVEIIGQQFAMARHLGQDNFLVSNLVGIAIASIAWNDALHLVQHPKTPNLYWALTAMPSPLVDNGYSMAIERQFLYQQIKVLREVDEKPRPVGYWQDFVDRLMPQVGSLSGELNLGDVDGDPKLTRAAIVGFIAAAYPRARDYLIEEQQMPRRQVEAYPTAQVVFLAMVKFHDYWRDEYFKWVHVPFWQARAHATSKDLDARMRDAAKRYGWIAKPTELMLPAVLAARTAQQRCVQSIALLKTVEAVRMYAADHDGKLPPSLADLSVPAPLEPFTGQPIAYQRLKDRAVLTGHSMPGMRYRLIVKIAK